MAPTAVHRSLTVALLAALSAFGAYATLITASNNGLLAATGRAVGHDSKPSARHYPGGPSPYHFSFTGVRALDDHLATLVSFFVLLLDAPKTLAAAWAARYLMTQFLAGWVLITLEGLRKGNHGRAVSWTGTVGAIFQNITYTVTVPLYLLLHLLTSPTSRTNPPPASLAIATHDLYVLPRSIFGAFVLPTVLMSLPVPSLVTATAHYNWHAAWQVFPLTQSLAHHAYKRLTAPLAFKADSYPQLDTVYRAVALLSFAPQTALLAVAATPAALVPDAVLDWVPGLTRDVFAQFTLENAFVPILPWNSPVAGGGARKAVSPEGLPALVHMFLQWDVYLGGAAILVWAVFVYSVARPEKAFWSNVLPRIAVYTTLGGPVGAATMLLWERDAVASREWAKTGVVATKQ